MLQRKMIVLMLIFAFNCSGNCLWAEELNISSETDKKYNLSICAIFKNEAQNLKDWIHYHLNLGVDHFYLYNTGSVDSFLYILFPYINEGLVTLVNWPEIKQDDFDCQTCELCMQFPAYENAVNFVARNETKWITLLDVDEYLVCPKENMTDLLLDYDVFPSISLTANIFDEKNKSLIPLKKIQPSPDPSEAKLFEKSKSVAKMIFKPDLCVGFTSPPYQCCFNTQQPGIEADPRELRINRYLNNNRKMATSKSKVSGYSLVFETGVSDKEQVHEYQNIPMYLFMPDFLKKLKSKQYETTPFSLELPSL